MEVSCELFIRWHEPVALFLPRVLLLLCMIHHAQSLGFDELHLMQNEYLTQNDKQRPALAS